MTTKEVWLAENIIKTTWKAPLNADDLAQCFRHLAAMLDQQSGYRTHILFDLREAGMIPASAPMLAIRSGFLTMGNADKVVVVSRDRLAQVLASLATSMTRKDILFFHQEGEAISYLSNC